MRIDLEKMGIGSRMIAVAEGRAEEGSVVYVCPCELKEEGTAK